LLKAGDRVWLEDPGYPPTRELLAHMHIAAVPVPVDAEGMVVAEGIRLAPRARAAVVTPAHQSPLCVSLSLPRRLALLDWAARNNAWIVEDDYDGEYRYVSRPLPALKSLDRDGRVLYAGTFSKVLFPSIRLAYLVVPPAQVERFEQIIQAFAGGSPELTQAIVTAFIRRATSRATSSACASSTPSAAPRPRRAWKACWASTCASTRSPGGMHLILRLQGRQSDRALVARMREDGLYARRCRLDNGRGKAAGLLLNFTNIARRPTAETLGRRILALDVSARPESWPSTKPFLVLLDWAKTRTMESFQPTPRTPHEQSHRLRQGLTRGLQGLRRRVRLAPEKRPAQGTGRPRLPARVADQRLRLLHRHAFARPAQVRPRGRQARAGAGVARRGRGLQPRERAALAWAETVTRVADTGVPDADYDAAAAEFSDKELADLTYAIGLMNAFNRLGVSFRVTPAAAVAQA
jgi:hypothetical protein